jgi:hypothetical protein
MRVRKAPIRIAIHPNDVVNQLVRNANISTIDRLVGHGYESKTYIQKYWEINHLQELNLGYQAN